MAAVNAWTSGVPLDSAHEASLAAFLFPAMVAGTDLRIDGPVSARLIEAVPAIQQIFRLWDRRAGIIRVGGSGTRTAVPPTPTGVGCFFSAGVDSFYSVLQHRDEITELVFVHGFDVPLERATASDRIVDGVRSAAAEMGKPLVEVWTDLRRFSDPRVSWNLYHGAALAMVAHLLSARFERVYVPATHTFAHLLPWGSHPLLDPLWSTEALEIVHDGAGVTRPEKVEFVSAHDVALSWLRVCWESRATAYNCGSCEKCLRTMAALELSGALQRSRTFPVRLDLAKIRRLRVQGDSGRAFWSDVAVRAGEKGNRALAEAAVAAMRRRGDLRKMAHRSIRVVRSLVRRGWSGKPQRSP